MSRITRKVVAPVSWLHQHNHILRFPLTKATTIESKEVLIFKASRPKLLFFVWSAAIKLIFGSVDRLKVPVEGSKRPF